MGDDTGALAGLIDLRRRREDDAGRALSVANERHEAATRELEDGRRALRTAAEGRESREDCLFGELRESAGGPADLERYRHAMQAVARDLSALGERVERLEADLDGAAATLERERRGRWQALRKREAVETLRSRSREADGLAARRREEEEMDEWRPVPGAVPAEPA